jgi:thiosulfate dehydrogenase
MPLNEKRLVQIIEHLNSTALLCVVSVIGIVVLFLIAPKSSPDAEPISEVKAAVNPTVSLEEAVWTAPDSTKIPNTPHGDLIRYGRELVAHTAALLGPEGSVASISNGMNCQNCHLKAGKKLFGNSYAAVASTYPKFRARSGSVESVEKRVNDCIERSLNGKRLDEQSREMKAFVAYITWVGSEVKKGVTPQGARLLELPELDRAADPVKGKLVFQQHCVRCHGARGEGLKDLPGPEWHYPPLADNNSYNVGAGLYRLSRFAAYVKANMPNGVTYDNPTLTDEEAWDVAAFVNSLPRPGKDLSSDWPDISKKPFDHPFGPYADTFSESQHKYGPFAPIKAAQQPQ